MDNKELLDQLEGVCQSLLVFEQLLASTDKRLYIHAETVRSIGERISNLILEIEK